MVAQLVSSAPLSRERSWVRVPFTAQIQKTPNAVALGVFCIYGTEWPTITWMHYLQVIEMTVYMIERMVQIVYRVGVLSKPM